MENQNKKASKQYFDSQAENYDNSHDGKFVLPMYSEILRLIKEADVRVLLDVGCGTGNVLAQLVDTDMSLLGIDISEKMIEVAARRLGERAQLAAGDAERLPYQNESIDFIVCNASFHHYPNPQKVLSEMHRVLTPKGTLLIGDPQPPSLVRAFMNIVLKYSNSGDYRLYSKSDFAKQLSKCGFEMCYWTKPTYKTCILEAKKVV